MELAKPAALLKTLGGYQVTTPAGTNDVVVTLNNVEVLRISLGANMKITTQGDLTIEANNIHINSRNNMDVKVSNSLDVRASTNASLQGSGTLTLRGNPVNVNSQSFPGS